MQKCSAFAVAALMLAGAAGTASCTAAAPHSASHAPSHRMLFQLHDQGSTNTPAWVLTVNTDGSGTLTNDDTGGGNGSKSFKAGTFDSASLAAALGQLNVGHLPRCPSAETIAPVEVNTGSVSFGSHATLFYKGKVIRSFCPDSPAEAAVTSQLSRVVAIANP